MYWSHERRIRKSQDIKHRNMRKSLICHLRKWNDVKNDLVISIRNKVRKRENKRNNIKARWV